MTQSTNINITSVLVVRDKAEKIKEKSDIEQISRAASGGIEVKSTGSKKQKESDD